MSTTTAVQPTNKGGLSCADVLNIAERDASIAYRDLSGFRVTLELRSDGWHVDYDLTDPLIAGGGPHYVIDPLNGQITAKRYEQ
jgi:hypothetical protein